MFDLCLLLLKLIEYVESVSGAKKITAENNDFRYEKHVKHTGRKIPEIRENKGGAYLEGGAYLVELI